MIVYRKEEKYILNQFEYRIARDSIRMIMNEDEHLRDDNNYWIRSLYFDTQNDKDYYEKAYGISVRQKFRVRIYDLQSDYAKLEIKNKINDNGYKESATITKNMAELLSNGSYDCLLLNSSNEIAKKIYYHFVDKAYSPKVIVDYEREAYHLNFNNIRITFDKNVRALNSNDLYGKGLPMVNVIPSNTVVMEVKYNGFLPDHIKKCMEAFSSVKFSVSKYCLSRNIMGGYNGL